MKTVKFIVSVLLVCCFLSALYVPKVEITASAATYGTKFSEMLARAEAMCNYEWVPASNIYTWNGNSYKGRNYFKKGETVKGIPYTLFFYELNVDSLLSLAQYKKVASKNYSTTAYAYSAGANRTGPVYGNCCATFVSEVWGGHFMNGDNPRYDSVYKIRYNSTDYSTTTTGVKLSNVKAGDALSNTKQTHIIWVGAITSTTVTIYESTPPVCKKTVLNRSSCTDSNGYLYYAGGTYSIRHRSKQIVYDEGGTTTPDPTPTEPTVEKVYTSYTPIKALPTASANFNVQEADFSTTAGTIYTTDLCTINHIYKNGWCQVTYPTSSSTKTAYTKISNFVYNTSYTPKTYKSSAAITTYETKSLTTKFGSVGSNSTFYAISEYGSATQVMYKISAGGYKFGWIKTSDLPSDEPTVPDTSDDPSEPSTSEDPSEPSTDPSEPETSEPEVDSSSLTYGKTYETGGLYNDGTTYPYPDENGKSMTDGISAGLSTIYSDATLAGFNNQTDYYLQNGYASITVDLGSTYNLNKMIAYVSSVNEENTGAGVHTPSSVEFYVSTDKSTWTKAGAVTPTANSKDTNATLTLTTPVVGRYVQYRFISSTSWIMVSEVKAYGSAYTSSEPSDPEPSVPEVDKSSLTYGKTYVAEGLYFETPGEYFYPDGNGKSMTDGIAAGVDATYDNTAFAGFNGYTDYYLQNGYVSITVDLGSNYNLNKLIAYVSSSNEENTGAGVNVPKTVEFYVSGDNSTWFKAGAVSPVANSADTNATLNLTTPVAGRYIQYRFISDTSWIMVSEVKAYGNAHTHSAGSQLDWNDQQHYNLCSCGEHMNVANHDDGKWYVIKEAQIGVEGEKELRCTVCNYVLKVETIPALEDPQPPVIEPEFIKGDVNESGAIDSMDYVLLKRAYFGTYQLENIKIGDIDDSGKIESMDYIYLRRAYFGTYNIK